MEETGNVLNVLRQIHSLDNSEEDICEQEQVSRLTSKPTTNPSPTLSLYIDSVYIWTIYVYCTLLTLLK